MRCGFRIGGILGEHARVWFDGALVEPTCVVSENHAGMTPVIETLGRAGMPNTNHPKAAKRLTSRS